ncbi:MAG: nitroreductase [Paracoccaceae bacterium]|nr:nitroreductase [Paracoccaceae bacterium]
MTDAFHAFSELLNRRHSCRAFLPKTVDRNVMDKIILAAGRAPSWCNSQPWHVIVTSGGATDAFRDALTKASDAGTPPCPDVDWPRQYAGVFRERRSTCGWQLYDAVGVQKGDRAASARQSRRNMELFDAPHTAIITSEEDLGPYGLIDCGGFITAFTLAAEALGVATVPQAAVAAYSPLVRSIFDIPENRVIVCAISFGYRDKAHSANSFRTNRATLAEVVDWRD